MEIIVGSMGIVFLTLMLVMILIFIKIGMKYEEWLERRKTQERVTGLQIAEGAIFALLGLLVAFTFSSAGEKFDQRRLLTIEESNAISTAYNRIDLVLKQDQTKMRQQFAEYISIREKFYQNIHDLPKANEIFFEARSYQTKIWQTGVESCRKTDDTAACMLLLPALNAMFDMGNYRVYNMLIHPPILIFIMLIGIIFLTAFLTGFSIRRKKMVGHIHILSYAIVITVVIYVIFDFEYPRFGFIKVDAMDRTISDLKTEIVGE